MIDKTHFFDGYSREYNPNKGWIKGNGEQDELTFDYKNESGQVSVVVDTLSHGNWHTTENLQDQYGTMLLPKGVRKITWYDAGHYIIEDNNEDELINKYGYISTKEYHESFQIADKNGRLLVDDSFDELLVFSKNGFLVRKNGKYNVLLLSGHYILDHFVDAICSYYKNDIFFVDEGVLYSSSLSGKIKKCKELYELSRLPSHETYLIYAFRRYLVENNMINGINPSEITTIRTGVYAIHMIISSEIRIPILINYIVNGKYLLFNNWYDIIEHKNFGLYTVHSEEGICLINGSEEIIQTIDDKSNIIVSDQFYTVVENRNLFSIYDESYELLYTDFTSIMWSDRVVWGMNTFSFLGRKHYFHGECEEILNYAHEVLISKRSVALFEKEGVWYYIDTNGTLHECFRNYKLNY